MPLQQKTKKMIKRERTILLTKKEVIKSFIFNYNDFIPYIDFEKLILIDSTDELDLINTQTGSIVWSNTFFQVYSYLRDR